MNHFIRHISLLLLCLVAVGAGANIYTWVDEQGRTHYSDTKPKDQKTKTVTPKIITYKSPSIEYNELFKQFDSTKREQAKRGKRVVMYSAEWCGVCKTARRYFEDNNIAFMEYDIDKDEQAKADFKKLNGRGVPIILVGKKRLNGFNVASFKQVYGS